MIAIIMRNLRIVFSAMICLLFSVTSVQTEELQNVKPRNGEHVQHIINVLRKIVVANNFTQLKQYNVKNEPLIWDICGLDDIGPGDEEPFTYPFDTIVGKLLEISKNVTIYISDDPTIIRSKDKEMIFIDTEGWLGEYPYLSFVFEYSKIESRWDWQGVCYSSGPRLRRQKNGTKYEETLQRQSQLPRPGPRIFRDADALKKRIIEIANSKSFDALKPYAIQQKIRFGECDSNLLEQGVQGKDVSVDQVVELLKKKSKGVSKFEFLSKGKYLEIKGWHGEHPYVFFEFTSEGGKGTSWTGVAYCKKSLMTMLFPDDPRFK